MKRIYTILILVMLAGCAFAQEYYDYDVPPGYDAYYDYDHKVFKRKVVYCDEDYMDLWNGHSVRIINGYAYIYNSSNRQVITGKNIRLLSDGCYIVNNNGDTWSLYEPDGSYTGLWGKSIKVFWNGEYLVEVNNTWSLYDKNYKYTGIYTRGDIELCWNGYYIYDSGNGQYRVVDDDYKYIGVWGDKITLMHNGNFKVIIGSYTYIYDKNGRRLD